MRKSHFRLSWLVWNIKTRSFPLSSLWSSRRLHVSDLRTQLAAQEDEAGIWMMEVEANWGRCSSSPGGAASLPPSLPPAGRPSPSTQERFPAAGWKALSSLSVLIIRFLTAPLIVDHAACCAARAPPAPPPLLICLACRFSPVCSTLWDGVRLLMNGGRDLLAPVAALENKRKPWKPRERGYRLQPACNNSPLTPPPPPAPNEQPRVKIIHVIIISSSTTAGLHFKTCTTFKIKEQNTTNKRKTTPESPWSLFQVFARRL